MRIIKVSSFVSSHLVKFHKFWWGDWAFISTGGQIYPPVLRGCRFLSSCQIMNKSFLWDIAKQRRSEQVTVWNRVYIQHLISWNNKKWFLMILAQTEFHMRESYSSTLEGQMLRKISNRARRLIVIVKMMQDAANKLWKYPQPLGLDTDTRLDKCLYLSQGTKSFSDGIDLFVPANYVCDWGNRSSCVVVSPVMGESDRRAQGSLGKKRRRGGGEEKYEKGECRKED